MHKFLNFLCIFCILLFTQSLHLFAEEKIKIGLLIPMTGENKQLGQSIIKSSIMALEDIDSNKIEIFPKNTNSNPNKTLRSAIELKELGVKIIIGPIFHESLTYLNEVDDIIFLSLTNKTINLPKNVIASGVNSTSQLNTIKKFIVSNNLDKSIILSPTTNYDKEIKKALKDSKLKILKYYNYDREPTKLTQQIEEITNYNIRKQNLIDEIYRIENSDIANKERILENLKKKYTIGNVKFDSVIIADFEESLKSVITSLLYTDVSPKEKYIITFNQWFEKDLLNEKTIQPIFYPSINKGNLEEFENKFLNKFNEKPSHLNLLSYDLVGLIYYLSLKYDLSNIDKIFKKKNSFKGKIGIFDIKDNKINHRLNFYKIEDGLLKEIF